MISKPMSFHAVGADDEHSFWNLLVGPRRGARGSAGYPLSVGGPAGRPSLRELGRARLQTTWFAIRPHDPELVRPLMEAPGVSRKDDVLAVGTDSGTSR